MKLKIGYATYELSFVKNVLAEKTSGSCSTDKREIQVDSELNKADTLATLLHETLHGIWDMWEMGDVEEEEEEKKVSQLTNGLMAVIVDNKKLIKELLDKGTI